MDKALFLSPFYFIFGKLRCTKVKFFLQITPWQGWDLKSVLRDCILLYIFSIENDTQLNYKNSRILWRKKENTV